jgi:hypothetical protein
MNSTSYALRIGITLAGLLAMLIRSVVEKKVEDCTEAQKGQCAKPKEQGSRIKEQGIKESRN